MTFAKTILSLCDYSGNWSLPYREADYNVIQVDLKLGQDIRLIEKMPVKIHGILAAPPCTAFAASGAQYWKEKDERGDTLAGLALVDACLRAVSIYQPEWWVLENPVGRLRNWLGDPIMIFQPYEFGDPYMKKTCLWGHFNSDFKHSPCEPQYRMMGASKKRNSNGVYRLPEMTVGRDGDIKELRSTTPLGFARAFFEANP